MKSNDDPYDTLLVDDLLRGISDWTHTPDIVRLTFKAFSEVLKAQGQSIREIERQMPSLITRSEMLAANSQKADYPYVREQLSNLRIALEDRSNINDLQHKLDDKVSYTDLAHHLNSKANLEDFALFEERSKRDLEENLLVFEKDFSEKLPSRRETDSLRIDLKTKEERLRLLEDGLNKSINYIEDILRSKVDQRYIDEILAYKLDISEIDHKISPMIHSKAEKHEVARVQEFLKNIEKELENKIRRTSEELRNMISAKAEVFDIQKLGQIVEGKADIMAVDQLSLVLDEKMEVSEFQHKYLPLIIHKAEKTDLEEIQKSISNFQRDSSLRSQKTSDDFDSKMNLVRSSVDKLRNDFTGFLAGKADIKEFDKLMGLVQKKADSNIVSETIKQQSKELQTSFYAKISELNASLRTYEEDFAQKLATSSQSIDNIASDYRRMSSSFNDVKNEMGENRESIDLSLKKAVQAWKTDLATEISNVRKEIQVFYTKLEELGNTKTSKVDHSALKEEVEKKVDLENMEKILSSLQEDLFKSVETSSSKLTSTIDTIVNSIDKKADTSSLIKLKASIEDSVSKVSTKITDVQSETRSKVPIEDFKSAVQSLKEGIDAAERSIEIKASAFDLSSLLEKKADIEELNKALIEIHEEIDSKANRSEIGEQLAEQLLINETICSELTIGRWIWKNKDLKSGSVPWDLQVVNTCPENYLWEPEQNFVIIVTPGLYEISFGFYARKKPSVQLLLNGEPVLTPVNTAAAAVQHSSAKLKSLSATSVTGLTLTEFLVLPARARLSMRYNGDPTAEGFLGIKKL